MKIYAVKKSSSLSAFRFAMITAAISCLLAFASPSRPAAADESKTLWKIEKHMGKATVEEVRGSYGFIQDPLLNRYVSGMGRQLAAVSYRNDIPYEFFIVDSDEVNAFAAPGGFVFVTRGLIEKISNDDELATVMGHEIGHVSAHHGAKQIKRYPILLAVGSVLSSQSEMTQRIGGAIVSLLQLHYSRDDENQADSLGVDYSAKSGYNPAAMLSFFKKLEKISPTGGLSRVEVAFASHPKTSNRIWRIQTRPELADTAANHLRYARAYSDRLYYDEAAHEFEKAFALDPKNEEAAAGAGNAFLKYGNATDSIRMFTAAVYLNPADADSQKGLQAALDLQSSSSENPLFIGKKAKAGDVKQAASKIAEAREKVESSSSRTALAAASVKERTSRMRASFNSNLFGYQNTAKQIASTDYLRTREIKAASDYFGGMLNSLDGIDSAADGLSAFNGETIQIARAAEYIMNRPRHRSAKTAAAARELAAIISQSATASINAAESLKKNTDDTEESLNNADSAMRSLGDSIMQTNANIISTYMIETGNSLRSGNRLLNSALADTKKTKTAREREQARLRRAVLNFDASLLSPSRDELFGLTLERRFGLKRDDDTKLQALGYGWADILLIQSRAADAGTSPVAFASESKITPRRAADILLSPKSDNRSAMLLLTCAETDLQRISGLRPAAALSLEPDPTASEAVKSFSSDSPDFAEFASVAARIDSGDSAAVVDYFNNRNKDAVPLGQLMLGLALKNTGEYDQAEIQLKYSASRDASNYFSHYLLASTYSELERFADAANEYGEALKNKPNDAVALSSLAYSRAMLGNAEEAIADYKKAIAAGMTGAAVHRNLGLLYYEEGMLEDAAREFAASLAADPDQPRIAAAVDAINNL